MFVARSYVRNLNYFYLLLYCPVSLIRDLLCMKLQGSFKHPRLERCSLAELSIKYFQIICLVIQLNILSFEFIHCRNKSNPSTHIILLGTIILHRVTSSPLRINKYLLYHKMWPVKLNYWISKKEVNVYISWFSTNLCTIDLILKDRYLLIIDLWSSC